MFLLKILIILIILVIIKQASEANTIVGPVAKLNIMANAMPEITDIHPIKTAYITICNGVRLMLKALAAGIISIAVINNIPIILKEIAINNANTNAKLNLRR